MTATPYVLRQLAGGPPGGAAAERHAGLSRAEVGRIIAEGCFCLAAQPVVRLADRDVVHHEVRLRLRPPPGLPPLGAGLFVDAAEHFGLSCDLDEAVLVAACQAPQPLAVNLCARSLQQQGFAARVLARVSTRPAPPILELVRVGGIDDLRAVAVAVAGLRAAGVAVALDEVDGGPASLACLQAARFDQLKLAGGVVRAAMAGERGRRLLEGLLRLAAATGASTVAKQIETLPQAWAMQRAGVALGQGWLFGAPAPLAGG